MNQDIRLSVDFWDHPKTIKLEKRLGFDGPRCLQRLWMWAANNRPNGVFYDMDSEDIEIAAKWEGDPGLFIHALLELKWAESDGEVISLHSWQERNPWAASSPERGDKARLSRMAQTHPEIYQQLVNEGATSVTKEHYAMLTIRQRDVNAAPAPSPSPSPSPCSNESLTKDEASFVCQDAERPDDEQVSQEQENPDERKMDLPDPGIPNCPHKEIIAAYHEILPELNAVKVLTDEREKWLRTRWREDKKRQSVQWWRQYWQLVRKCPFLMGQNGNSWRADFSWLIRPNNFAKVYEGKYLDKPKHPRLGL